MDYFKLKQNKTTVSTEIYAGLTTFMTMAYILIVNPDILQHAGMDKGAVFTATAISSFVATLFMGIFANYPFALAPGMGLNAYFAFTVAKQFGWEMALLAVFVEGCTFIVLSFFNVREAIFDAIPDNLKKAVSVGIGLFITLVGLNSAGIVVFIPDSSILALGDVHSTSFILSFFGIIITAVFLQKKVRGALFWGILSTYLVGVICELLGVYVPDNVKLFSLIPSGIVSMPASVKGFNIVSAVSNIIASRTFSLFEFFTVAFAFFFVDVFDTVGTLVGVSSKAGFLDKNGKLPRIKQAFIADAFGTIIGAVFGTSAVTTYVESAAGVSDGGRTGLTSVVTALLFLLALFFYPIFSVIPAFATAPALVMVGWFMMESVTEINFSDPTEGIPAFIAIFMMPFAYSISEGLVFGVLSYVIIKFLTGKHKDISIVMYIVGALFFLKLVLS